MEKETQQEFVKIRTEFSDYQKDLNKKIDELFDAVNKPMFTNSQIIGGVITLIIYTFYITNHISNVRQIGEANAKTIDKQELQIKEDRKANSDKIDKIYEIVLQTKEDVAILKDKKTAINKNPTSAQRQQMVLDWANGKN